jgi:hypothetical protein
MFFPKFIAVALAMGGFSQPLPANLVGEESDRCLVEILSPATGLVVPSPVGQITVEGTAGSAVTGILNWSNSLNSESGTAPAGPFWRIENIPLGVGVNVLTVVGGEVTEGTTDAADQGGNSAYSNGWSNDSNGGIGFDPWVLETTAPSSANGGFFMAQSIDNLDIGPRAWAMYSNSGNLSQAVRPLTTALQVGQTLSVAMDHNDVNWGAEVGIALENAGGETLWAFWFTGGEGESYQMTGQTTDLFFSEAGFEVKVTLTDLTQYTAMFTLLADGSERVYAGSLAPVADQTITRFRAYNRNAGPNASRNFYLNDLSVTTPGTEGERCSASVVVIREAPTVSLYINEYMASNTFTLADEDGDYEDWIELHNAGEDPLSLAGFGLSDNPLAPFRWVFPDVTLGAGDYLVVWASGKDRRADLTNGILREVYTGIPGTSVSDLTSHPSFPDEPATRNLVTQFFEAPSNIGDNYGQRMHGYILPPMTGNYRFWIASDDQSVLSLNSDHTPENLDPIASVPEWTNPREWGKYPQQRSRELPLVAGQRYYIQALHKEGGFGDNLAVAWQLPNGAVEAPIPASYLYVRSQLHTNFSISASGEPLQLTAPGGSVVDFVPARALPSDVSLGRSPTDAEVWFYYQTATPGAPNGADGFTALLDPPEFSVEAGMHSAPFALEITSEEEGVAIRYTTDGSVPTETSPLYLEPLFLAGREGESNLLSAIPTNDLHPSEYDAWQEPRGEVFKINTIRARAFRTDSLPSPVVTRTYLVHPTGASRYSLPVFSLTTDAENFFDPDDGIYVPGNAAGGNFSQRGRDWERPAHLEFFEADGSLAFAQNVGVRIHGGTSRNRTRKGLRIYARSQYGASSIEYPLFPGKPHVTSFKRFLLRHSGNDWGESLFRDAFMQSLLVETGIDLQSSRPAILFINGEYWGVHNIRDRYDEHYFDSHYGSGDEENITVMENNSVYSLGDVAGVDHYLNLLTYLQSPGVSHSADLAQVETWMDVDNFINYQIANIYFRNTDWPGNNLVYWRYASKGYQPDAPQGLDGRWRWALLDTDFGFGLDFNYVTASGSAYGGNDAFHNTLGFALDPNQDSWPNPAWSTLILRRLTMNADVRARFINRFADLLNTSFSSDRVVRLMNAKQSEYAPEMEEHLERWSRPSSGNAWNSDVQVMRKFAEARPESLRAHLMAQFNEPTETKTLTLDVSGSGAGYIRVNTVEIRPGTPGVSSETYPWNGVYFRGVPVEVTAVPNPDYTFGGWAHDPTAPATITVTSDMSLTANFSEKPALQTIHYWSFNAVDSLLAPSYTVGAGTLAIEVGSTSELTHATGQDFQGENARFDNEAGPHLRLNHPLGSSVTVTVPTIGFEAIVVSYETRRSGQGAGRQVVSYTTDGSSYQPFASLTTFNAPPVVHTLDFSGIPATSNNPDFAVRIHFEEGEGGIGGNNRFDNLVVEGRSVVSGNSPPVLIQTLHLRKLIEGGDKWQILLNTFFSDPDGDVLQYVAATSNPAVADVFLSGNDLFVTPGERGEAILTITGSDGINAPVPTTVRVLVYPAAYGLGGGPFVFDEWSSGHPAGTFPEHMIFLQGDTDDTVLDTPLVYAYQIPPEDYAGADANTIGFPYNNTARTRLTGLNEMGILFVNTGRGRDLGGALVALDTRDVPEAAVGWTAGTVAPNIRGYAIRLQYRIGVEGSFTDLLDGSGQPVEYLRNERINHSEILGPVSLPADALGQEYVQLLWRYYLVEGLAGARAELRLDNIEIFTGSSDAYTVTVTALPEQGGTVSGAGLHPGGTTAEVVAHPSLYFQFSHWAGDVPAGDESVNPLYMLVDGDKTLTASFAADVTATTGTPHWWLASFDLTEPSFELASQLDHDGDGRAAWHEYIAGTDPTDSGSRFEIIDVAVDDPFEIRFESVATRLYTLQASPDLIDWASVPGQGPRRGIDGPDSFTLPFFQDHGFWRIQVQLPSATGEF